MTLRGMLEAEEQALVQELVAHASVEALNVAILHRLARRDVVPFVAVILRPGEDCVRVNSVPWSETIMPGLPRRPIRSVSSRATRRPEIEVSGIAARHSRVIDDVQHPKASSAGELVMHKVE
jgi:hypothetical protein